MLIAIIVAAIVVFGSEWLKRYIDNAQEKFESKLPPGYHKAVDIGDKEAADRILGAYLVSLSRDERLDRCAGALKLSILLIIYWTARISITLALIIQLVSFVAKFITSN